MRSDIHGYPVLVAVIVMVSSSIGAGAGLAVSGGTVVSSPAPTDPVEPEPTVQRTPVCTVETQVSHETVVETDRRIAENSSWEVPVRLDANEDLYLNVRNLAGVRPDVTVFDPTDNQLRHYEDVRRVEETIPIDRNGTYTVVLANNEPSHSGQWDVIISIQSTTREEVCR